MTVLENGTANSENAAANEAPPPTTTAPSFVDTLPESLRPTLGAKFKDLNSLANSYSELEKHLGADKATILKIPSERTPEAMREVHKALGAPETADGYEFNVPDDSLFSKESITELKSMLHAEGVPAGLAGKLQEWYDKQVQAIGGDFSQQREYDMQAAQSELKQSWGMAYDTNIRLVNAYINKTANDAEEAQSIRNAVGNNPVALRWLAKQAEQNVPAKDLEMLLHGRPTSPDSAKTRMAEIRAHPLYMDPMQVNNPQRVAMIKEMETLARVVNN